MTALELRFALKSLGLTQSAFARWLKSNPRTVRRWCAESGPDAREVPEAVAMLLRLMIVKGMSPDEVTRSLEPFRAQDGEPCQSPT